MSNQESIIAFAKANPEILNEVKNAMPLLHIKDAEVKTIYTLLSERLFKIEKEISEIKSKVAII